MFPSQIGVIQKWASVLLVVQWLRAPVALAQVLSLVSCTYTVLPHNYLELLLQEIKCPHLDPLGTYIHRYTYTHRLSDIPMKNKQSLKVPHKFLIMYNIFLFICIYLYFLMYSYSKIFISNVYHAHLNLHTILKWILSTPIALTLQVSLEQILPFSQSRTKMDTKPRFHRVLYLMTMEIIIEKAGLHTEVENSSALPLFFQMISHLQSQQDVILSHFLAD